MQKVKKGDIVQIAKGKDKGKKGKVISLTAGRRAVVEGANLATKHKRQTRQDQKGGRVSIEMPISLSNLLVVCKGCDKGVRVGFNILKDGQKQRFCKICKEAI